MNKKLFALFLTLALALSTILSLNIASASHYHDNYKEKFTTTEYFPDKKIVITEKRYARYDNEDRYSTNFYRNGYSYRNTRDYWDNHYSRDKEINYKYNKYYNRKNYDYNYDRDFWKSYNKGYYYTYTPYLRQYSKKPCYYEAPGDRLFYTKCPQ